MLNVGKLELEFDRLHVGDRIDLPGDMDHVGILEAADHLEDGVDLTDVGEKLVAEALAFARSLHDPGDVDELEGGRDHLLRRDEIGDPGQPLIGHAHHPLVGLDGAEGIVSALRRLRHRQGVEEGALADVGETDDACFHGCGENPGEGEGDGWGEGVRARDARQAGARRGPMRCRASCPILPSAPRGVGRRPATPGIGRQNRSGLSTTPADSLQWREPGILEHWSPRPSPAGGDDVCDSRRLCQVDGHPAPGRGLAVDRNLSRSVHDPDHARPRCR